MEPAEKYPRTVTKSDNVAVALTKSSSFSVGTVSASVSATTACQHLIALKQNSQFAALVVALVGKEIQRI